MACGGCSSFDTTQTVDDFKSFGEVVYREGCQRVAYTGQLAQKEAGQIQTVDVSGSLGHSVCVDGMPAPADAPPKLKAIQTHKVSLIAVVDAILPKPFLPDLEGFLEAILPLTDEGVMPDAIKSLGNLLTTMSQDKDFPAALAHLANRNGYRPTKTAVGLMHAIVEYPQIDDFLTKTLGLIAPGGTAEVEFKGLLGAMSSSLKYASPVANAADPERTLRLALNLLTTTHGDLSTGTPRPLVQRDFRGLARVSRVAGKLPAPFVDKDGDGYADVDAMGHFVGADGQPFDAPTPFPQMGVADSTPRDSLGRALTAANATTTLYDYYDLDGTVFGGLARESLSFMDPIKDVTIGLVHGVAALLGPRMTQTKMYTDDASGTVLGMVPFNGFDTTQAAVLDLLHAFIQILGDPGAHDTLTTATTLLTQHESETSRLIKAMLDSKDLGKMHPEAQVPEQSTIYDELMPLIQRVLRVPGLAQDLLIALEDPRVKGFAPMVGRLMHARNQVDFDHAAGPNYTLVGTLDTVDAVNRNMPDVDYNRSIMQRLAHLIHDSNNTQFCNKDGAQFSLILNFGPYQRCKLFQIDDLALFFILNMASASARSANPSAEAGANFCQHITDGLVKATASDNLIQNQTGITGFTCHPTPAALNRALFLRNNEKSSFMQGTTDDVLCSDGDKFIDVHDKSLSAWEMKLPGNPSGNVNDTFYDAVQPIIDAFAKHDECDAMGNCHNAAKIFIDIFAMLHEHWTSEKGSYFGHTYQSSDATKPRYAHPDALVSYEPLLDEVLENGDMVPSVIGLAPVLNSINTDGSPVGGTGIAASDALVASARYLFDPNGSPKTLAYRDGTTTSVWSDGKTPVAKVTPYYLLADAFAHKRASLALAPADQQGAWASATSALVDQMLTIEKQADGSFRMKNRRMHAITLVLLDFVQGRLATHSTKGDLEEWVHKSLTGDLTDVLGSPVFAAAADFVAKVEGDPDARTQLYGLLSYLVDEANNDLTFQTALTTLADQVQTFMDDPNLVPVAHMLSAAVDPMTGPTHDQLNLVNKAHALDAKHALLTILRNLYRPSSDGVYPASDLADVLSEINRAQPGAGGPLLEQDYRVILGDVANFLGDHQRGYARFLDIVKSRGPQP